MGHAAGSERDVGVARQPRAEPGIALGAPSAAAPAVFGLAQAIQWLRTSFTPERSFTSDRRSPPSITYASPATWTLGGIEAAGFRALGSGQRNAVRAAMALWDDVIAKDIVEVASGLPDITIAYSSTTRSGGTYSSLDIGTPSGPNDYGGTRFAMAQARVWLSTSWTALDADSDFYDPAGRQIFGNYGFFTYLHEIGHSLGLSHPGIYNAGSGTLITYARSAEFAQDTRKFTVMSYFNADADGSGTDHFGSDGQWDYASTPMLLDIAAVQAIYGADMTTRTGDTVYGFGSTAGRDVFDFTRNVNPVISIWDAGGSDTLDASGWSSRQLINLNAGTFSSLGDMTDNVSIAYGAVIENGVGGGGVDTIVGNEFDNILIGGAGADILLGGDGHDSLTGGTGGDVLVGGSGNDWISYRNAAASVAVNLALSVGTGYAGEALGDAITGVENISGSAYGDYLYGDAAANILLGGPGADVLYGGDNSDTVYYADSVAGVFVDLATNTASGGAAEGDILVSVENVVGTPFNDTLVGDNASNTLYAGVGVDRLTGNGGNDIIVWRSVFESSIVPGQMDVVTDFWNAHGDLLDFSGIDADGDPGNGDQAFEFIGEAGFSHAGQIRQVLDTTSTRLELTTSGGLDVTMAVLLSNGRIALTPQDLNL